MTQFPRRFRRTDIKFLNNKCNGVSGSPLCFLFAPSLTVHVFSRSERDTESRVSSTRLFISFSSLISVIFSLLKSAASPLEASSLVVSLTFCRPSYRRRRVKDVRRCSSLSVLLSLFQVTITGNTVTNSDNGLRYVYHFQLRAELTFFLLHLQNQE